MTTNDSEKFIEISKEDIVPESSGDIGFTRTIKVDNELQCENNDLVEDTVKPRKSICLKSIIEDSPGSGELASFNENEMQYLHYPEPVITDEDFDMNAFIENTLDKKEDAVPDAVRRKSTKRVSIQIDDDSITPSIHLTPIRRNSTTKKGDQQLKSILVKTLTKSTSASQKVELDDKSILIKSLSKSSRRTSHTSDFDDIHLLSAEPESISTLDLDNPSMIALPKTVPTDLVADHNRSEMDLKVSENPLKGDPLETVLIALDNEPKNYQPIDSSSRRIYPLDEEVANLSHETEQPLLQKELSTKISKKLPDRGGSLIRPPKTSLRFYEQIPPETKSSNINQQRTKKNQYLSMLSSKIWLKRLVLFAIVSFVSLTLGLSTGYYIALMTIKSFKPPPKIPTCSNNVSNQPPPVPNSPPPPLVLNEREYFLN
ncbi:hypothetical protein HDV02_005487 [Globomyces sp. JEL0801]|nr:hypothetical protein HDV02_005487 [Globomyces sp. JEL0801]